MRTLIAFLFLALPFHVTFGQTDLLRDEANAAVAAGQIDIAIGKYRELVSQAPDDGSAHYQLGILMMDNGRDTKDAVEYFKHAAKSQFQPLSVAYRLSRIYARDSREDQAFEQLETMANGGFGLISLIDGQSDYDEIRNHPRFVAAVAAIRATRFPCQNDKRHHAFDFWIGEWNVKQNGQLAGTNSIQPILGHCVLFERWESINGSLGKSFNYYDPGQDHWRQIWVGDTGTFIEFTGEARDGGIFYTAETVNPAEGSVTHHKFEFTTLEDGDVRQFWQTSTDDGETWATIWDGRYTRKTE